MRIFISYGRKDARELAIQLRDDFQSVGHDVWLDLAEIPGGESWSQQIEQAIEDSQVTLALMSESSYESQWCRAEQLRSIRKGKRVIPLLVQKDAEPPLHLEHLNYLDFSDPQKYEDMFRDLVSDVTAGQAFYTPSSEDETTTPSTFRRRTTQSRTATRKKRPVTEKRNAPAFRRHIKQLREEDWLGSRHWWTYFLFHFTDMNTVVSVLKEDELASPAKQGQNFNQRWDKFVRFYFRPRTPDLFRNEGFRVVTSLSAEQYCPIPIYLLFDLEAILLQQDASFSEGDPAKTKKTYKTPTHFHELPFEQIYHDTWFMPDEREEILKCREAQVIVPDQIGLEGLQYIWVRSRAEYETLHNLLPDEIWQKWRNKITVRTDYHLFNRKWLYVEDVHLDQQKMVFRFNHLEAEIMRGEFVVMIVVELPNGKQLHWQHEAFTFEDELQINLPEAIKNYEVQLLLNGDVAYYGKHQPLPSVL